MATSCLFSDVVVSSISMIRSGQLPYHIHHILMLEQYERYRGKEKNATALFYSLQWFCRLVHTFSRRINANFFFSPPHTSLIQTKANQVWYVMKISPSERKISSEPVFLIKSDQIGHTVPLSSSDTLKEVFFFFFNDNCYGVSNWNKSHCFESCMW